MIITRPLPPLSPRASALPAASQPSRQPARRPASPGGPSRVSLAQPAQAAGRRQRAGVARQPARGCRGTDANAISAEASALLKEGRR